MTTTIFDAMKRRANTDCIVKVPFPFKVADGRLVGLEEGEEPELVFDVSRIPIAQVDLANQKACEECDRMGIKNPIGTSSYMYAYARAMFEHFRNAVVDPDKELSSFFDNLSDNEKLLLLNEYTRVNNDLLEKIEGNGHIPVADSSSA